MHSSLIFKRNSDFVNLTLSNGRPGEKQGSDSGRMETSEKRVGTAALEHAWTNQIYTMNTTAPLGPNTECSL